MDDMIDLSTVRILNSPDVHGWPVTTAITLLELSPTGVRVIFTKQDGPERWPDFPFGDPKDAGTLQYTLWICLFVAGQWLAAGCIEFWYGREPSGGPIPDYAKNWYYDPNRWPGMAGYQPQPGEHVGFFVTSGDARHGDEAVGLHERSNIVKIVFPDAAGAVYTFDAPTPAPAPVPTPSPSPTPAPVPPPAPLPVPLPAPDGHDELARMFDLLEQLVEHVEQQARSAMAIESAVETLVRDGVRVHL